MPELVARQYCNVWFSHCHLAVAVMRLSSKEAQHVLFITSSDYKMAQMTQQRMFEIDTVPLSFFPAELTDFS